MDDGQPTMENRSNSTLVDCRLPVVGFTLAGGSPAAWWWEIRVQAGEQLTQES
jgi:hypothetical protein